MSVWKNERGTWTAKFWYQNKPYKKEGFKKKSEGQTWELQKKEELRNPQRKTHSILFHDLATAYLEWCRRRYQKNTWRAKAKYFRMFIAYVGKDRKVNQIDRMDISTYLDSIADEYGAKTANRHRKDLSALYNWAIRNDLYQNNPIRTVEPFPEDAFVRYIPPTEDIHKLVLATEGEEQDLVLTLLDTGARIGEVFNLTWDDINFEKQTITLWTRKRKGGAKQSDKLAMTRRLAQTMQRRWRRRNKESPYVFCRADGSKKEFRDHKNLMSDACARAEITPFGFHALRHYVASLLADSGKATLGQIQRFLRHQRQTTTENYLHELEKGQFEIAEILDRKNGQDTGQDKRKKGEK